MQIDRRDAARDAGHQSQGRMPAPGWLRREPLAGHVALWRQSALREPDLGGILGNTNNKTVDRPVPATMSASTGATRSASSAGWRLMKAREVHTRDSFIEAQLDTVSSTARTLLPLIGADLWFTGEAAPDGTPERPPPAGA